MKGLEVPNQEIRILGEKEIQTDHPISARQLDFLLN